MEDDFDYGGEENRISEVSAVADVYRKFMYGIIPRSYKFCDVHLLCSCCSLNADWGECISRDSARKARSKFSLLFIKLTYL